MGTLLKSELIDEVSKFFASRNDLNDARYVRWLNLAQTRIARKRNFEELKKISFDTTNFTGDKSIDKFLSLPSNTRKITTVRLIDGEHSRKITVMLPEVFDKKVPYPEKYSTGRPEIAARWANQLEFWRVPDAQYRIEIRRNAWPTPFTTGSDVVSDLNEKDDALIMLAVSWGFLSLRNISDANFYWKIYSNMLNDIVGEEVETPELDISGFSADGISASSTPWADPFNKTGEI